MDIYEDRKGRNGEPIGDYALKLFSIIKAKGYVLVISDLLVRELEGYYSLAEVNGMMKPFEKLIEKVIATREQRDEAKLLAKERFVPPGDALHAIIARDNKLTLVTRDSDFRNLEDVSKHYKPEDII